MSDSYVVTHSLSLFSLNKNCAPQFILESPDVLHLEAAFGLLGLLALDSNVAGAVPGDVEYMCLHLISLLIVVACEVFISLLQRSRAGMV